uniref:NADH-ubiquinone oxidoreductase chain 3 n=1 Tax=Brachyrhynchus hsiaoi TaxID=928820 RepID=A0A059P0H4_9HEMI|nr:NADH dehydrogenase subunit 3 [Brachyrhynchus hsiaoi]ADQ64013.1 NADH dehydrogenase subunit 3 [Brachyrhynchus hsiaoi]
MATNMIMVTMAAALSIILMLLCTLISIKMTKDREKSSPFECGFDPMSSPRNPFSIQFFLISMIFLVFDVEIAIIIPMIVIFKTSSMWTWMMVMSSFLIVLILGLYHEWNNGALKWIN